MKFSLLKPLDKPAVVRMTYNGKEIFRSEEIPPGTTPTFDVAQPRRPGEGKMILVIDGKDIPVGMTKYSAANVAGILLNDAKAAKNGARSAQLIRRAVRIFEKVAPDSDDLAEAYRAYCFARWFQRGSKAKQEARRRDAVTWYERAVGIYEKLGMTKELAGNLTNMSVLYHRLGDDLTCMVRAVRGLNLQRTIGRDDNEAIGAWTHAAGACVRCGELEEAQQIIDEGMKLFADDPQRGYLIGIQAELFEARAKRCREEAEKILPPAHCAL